MNDMAHVIVPKSDQLNADDLIAGPITIKITNVTIRLGQEQPVSVFYEGDNGKPYKPCKGMCRVMVIVWGKYSSQYIGKHMTLYRNPTVKWGGMEVGGIEISHMSDLDSKMVIAITASKQKKKAVTVLPLVAPETAAPTAGEQQARGRAKEAFDLAPQSIQDAFLKKATCAIEEMDETAANNAAKWLNAQIDKAAQQ